jgi:hypothetical protein
MPRTTTLLGLLLLCAPLASAQQAGSAKAAPAIADNSFLLEEAYNQEHGVVQHISGLQRSRDGFWAYNFTQEWPAPGQKHQLSYTVPLLHFNNSTGLGDIGLNYRYQLLGAEGEKLWVSPRLTAYLPTGDESAGRGAGGAGVEVNLPVSYALSDAFVTHWNAGASYARLKNGSLTGSTRGLRGGASVIWLASPVFNVMLESVASRSEFEDAQGNKDVFTNYIISPGVRGAFNFASGLQIVPGIAMPIGVGSLSPGEQRQRDVFFYVSFEHPFR